MCDGERIPSCLKLKHNCIAMDPHWGVQN